MKNVLITTDFTPASRNAAMYGIQIARDMGSRIFLMNAYDVPVAIPESYVFFDNEDAWKSVEYMLKKELEELNQQNAADIEICGNEGAPSHAILELAAEKDIDLIICAMKSSAKGLRRLFGSTALSLIKKSKIPLLIVPDQVTYKKPQHLALAADLDMHTSEQTIAVFQQISKAFNARLSVVSVVTDAYIEAYEKRFQPSPLTGKLKELKAEFNYPQGHHVSDVLDNYMHHQGVDIFAMIPHQHQFPESFFIESTTRNMAFKTRVPLLVLPQVLIQEDNIPNGVTTGVGS